jgi:hypothetical protein
LFNVRFFGYASGLHPSLVGAPLCRAFFRSLCEGRSCGDAACKCSSDIALFRVINRYVGNLPPMPGVFPDYPAPIVRNGADGRDGSLGNAVLAARPDGGY